ncbi:MAG: hypothetical protein VXZ59_05680 [Cyanobacteriota bacterium]|nr:hypothetical protein [Cyanobacteriota bacterium]
MAQTLQVNGKTIHLAVPSDQAVAERIVKHFERRIAEDDWRPFVSKERAIGAWSRLGGIRTQVMAALGLL